MKNIDTNPPAVIQSGFSVFDQSTPGKEPKMTKQVKSSKKSAEAQPANTFVSIAELIDQKALEKEAKAQAIADKKAAQAAAKAAKAEAQLAAKVARDAKAAANKAAREGQPKMAALAEKVKSGAYVKSMTGQKRSTDALAVALDAVPATNVIKLAMHLLVLETNPYATLNVGQQSMNLRNKLRGAIKAGTVTMEKVIEVRDANGYATAEDSARERAEKKEAKKADAIAKAQAKEAAKATRVASKKSAETQAAAA